MTLLNEAECNLRVDHSDCIEDSLLATWQRTAWLLEDFSEVLGDECKVPYRETLNPPLWEIGHFNWFYEWFITRNPQWHLGLESHYDAERTESRLPHFDKVLDSSAIAHEPRWNEILPGRRDILEYQDLVHQDVLSCLNQARQLASEDDSNPDQVYYFFKLCLMHEQMHNEAAVFMAAQLGIPVRPEAANPRKASWQRSEGKTFHIPKQTWNLGWTGSGFCFDNEQPAHIVELNAFEIDASPVTWRQYIRFIQATEHPLPSGFQWAETQLKAKQFGHSRTVDLNEPVSHVNWHDAQAYCKWAGRELPTEAQWECAAFTQPGFAWGWVWEWTASDFTAFDGFQAHPYTAYSEPWFNERKVLKGASWATAAGMVNLKYRNFFQPERTDVISGFRTCKTLT